MHLSACCTKHTISWLCSRAGYCCIIKQHLPWTELSSGNAPRIIYYALKLYEPGVSGPRNMDLVPGEQGFAAMLTLYCMRCQLLVISLFTLKASWTVFVCCRCMINCAPSSYCQTPVSKLPSLVGEFIVSCE